MKKLWLVVLLVASPAAAQTQMAPTAAPRTAPPKASRIVDNCAPIGRTARGELVYSMKCDNMPAPPPPPVAEAPPPEPEPEVQRSGIFGLSYDRRKPE